MIEDLVLVTKSGPGEVATERRIATPLVTVFVGPNNSGKSLALRELLGFLDEPGSASQQRIIKQVAVRPFRSKEELVAALDQVPSRREGTATWYKSSADRDCKVTDDDLAKFAIPGFAFYLAGRIFVRRLDATTRLTLAEPVDGGDLLSLTATPQAALFLNAELRARLREAVHAATGMHLVIDPTFMGKLRFRLSERPPEDEEEEQGLSERSRNFHRLSLHVADQGDGIKAYVGLLAAVLATGHRVLLIDEPETFLHPPLARSLAAYLCAFARARQRQLFLATHSEHVVMGCIDSGVDVQIIRLSHERAGHAATSSAELLPPGEVAALMRDPLLRSTGAMAALFAPGAVVVEAASDRAFYKEIDYRLERAASGGTGGAVFLEAENWQTVHRIVNPLRSLGVRAAAITDIDVLFRPGTEFTNLMRTAGVPEAERQTIRELRDAVERDFSALGQDYKDKAKQAGVDTLSGGERSRCLTLIQRLAERGVFIVDVGELEGWLPRLSPGLGKKDWVRRMFERMGSDGEACYAKPEPGDVWGFVRRVGEWMRAGKPL